MGGYVGKRLLHALFVLWAVSVAVFLVARLAGDPAALFVGQTGTEADLVRVRHLLGLDKPLAVQYAIFLGGALRGDLGASIFYDQPALALVGQRLPATCELALAALLLALMAGVPAGVFAALRRGRIGDWGVVGLAVCGQSVPVFVSGVLAVMVFAVWLRWLPPSGQGGMLHLVLPATTLAAFSAAKIARLTRTSMLESLHEDYVRTARAKGAAPRRVVWRHALRNAALPVLTMAGLELGQLLSGVVVTETIFAWPGVGLLIMEAVSHRDYPVIQAVALVIAAVFVVVNLLVDLAYGLVDPRIRFAGGDR
jgi:peptide/nickel transport system permease protein